MATVDEYTKPLVLPICFAYDQDIIYTPIDKKPKKVSQKELKRIRNIKSNSDVSIVFDKYDENWNKLYYIIINGKAELISKGVEYESALAVLSNKYPQYREMGLESLSMPVIKIIPEKIISWGDL